MEEDRLSQTTASQLSLIDEPRPVTPLNQQGQKTNKNQKHRKAASLIRPQAQLPKLNKRSYSRLLENKNKVRQLAEELDTQGAPPSIMMLMNSNNIAEIFERNKVSTAQARVLKSRIKSVRESMQFDNGKQNQKFQQLDLQPKVRDFLKNNKEMTEIVADIQSANQTFENLASRVSLYRVELGELMDKLLCTYHKIFEQLIIQTIKIVQNKDKQMENLKKENQKAVENVLLQTKDTVENNRKLQNALTAANYRLEAQKQIEARLELEIKHLRQILRQDTDGYAKLAQDLKHGQNEGDGQWKRNAENNSTKEEIQSAAESKVLQENLKEMENLITKMEKKSNKKKNVLEDMRKLLLSIIAKNDTKDKAIQVGESELSWNVIPPIKVEQVEQKIKEFSLRDLIGRPKLFEGEWTLTPLILRFIANVGAKMELGRVLPMAWLKVKIYQIYKERLEMSNEIIGSVHPDMALDEFLIIWLLRKHKMRRLAEVWMLNFLATLRWWKKEWPRALMFCKFCGLTGDSASEELIIYSDPHTQQYFLYAFSLLLDNPENVIDNQDDPQTWVKVDKENNITNIILPWISANALKNQIQGIRKKYEKPTTNQENKDDKYVDVDRILEFYIQEFVKKRIQQMQVLSRAFNTSNQQWQGVLSLDDFISLIKKIIPSNFIEDLSFPADLSLSRAFRFAYMSGNNSFEITHKQFQACCVYFALDSPFPLIQISRETLIPFGLLQSAGVGSNQDIKNVGATFQRVAQNIAKGTSEELKQAKESILNTTKKVGNETTAGPAAAQQQKRTALPSYEAIGNLFSQHFSIIQEIQNHAKRLKEKFNENDWEANPQNCKNMLTNVEELIHVLDTALYTIKLPLRIKHDVM